MEPLVAELKRQYYSTLAMLTSTIEGCPETLWTREFAGVPFWREAYHALFWMHNFLGDQEKRFHFQPFGVDIDPRLSTPPNNTCEHQEALQYAEQTAAYIDEGTYIGSFDDLGACIGGSGYQDTDASQWTPEMRIRERQILIDCLDLERAAVEAMHNALPKMALVDLAEEA